MIRRNILFASAMFCTTGVRNELPPDLAARLSAIKAAVDVPICAGFGVSTHAQAEMISKAADGYIIGSALMRVLTDSSDPTAALAAFAKEVTGATK